MESLYFLRPLSIKTLFTTMPGCQMIFKVKEPLIRPHLTGSLDFCVPWIAPTVTLISSLILSFHSNLAMNGDLSRDWLAFFDCVYFSACLIIYRVGVF